MENYAASKLMEAKTYLNREKISRSFKKEEINDDQKLKKACEEFEGIMLQQILKVMRKTVPEGGVLEKSNGVSIWESVYDEKLSFHVAGKEKGMGLAKFLYEQLSKGSNLNIKS